MKHPITKLIIAIVFFLTPHTHPVFAANWLMLQGTEPTSATERAKLWGFIQGQYQHDFSEANSANQYTPAKLIGPNLTSNKMFNVNRARVGIRGAGLPLDSKINYFILSEFGNSGITAAGKHVQLTDASVTFNHLPFARIRAGLFKYPGSEESLQAIHASDYINFSSVTNGMMLERFPNDDNFFKKNTANGQSANTDPQLLGIAPNGLQKPVGAFRDTGLQVFDTIKLSNNWEHSYALMMGNGNGLNFGDNNGNKNMYYYWSSERVFAGQGGRREGLKIFLWHQSGQRAYDKDFSNETISSYDPGGDGIAGTSDDRSVEKPIIGRSSGKKKYRHYQRTRTGLGVKYLKNPYRISAEYIRGSGMIFLGPHKESFDMNEPGINSDGDGLTGTGNGWYIEGGWRVLASKWEIDLRYDAFNRLTGDKLEANFSTLTLGTQYFLNLKTRIAINYEIRNAKSANNIAALENNLNTLGNRLAIQFTVIY